MYIVSISLYYKPIWPGFGTRFSELLVDESVNSNHNVTLYTGRIPKSVQVEKNLDPAAIFNGDERDLLEVLGNVLDNAFKYGKSRVRVVVSNNGELEGRELVSIVVEDDGPGIDKGNQEFVLQRGARSDTLVQGQGIGLAVVTDIVDSYKGKISVGSSGLGGAEITISFAVLR